MTPDLEGYRSRGARALVLLHEQYLRRCLEVWKQAKAAEVVLPPSCETHYRSLETLLEHILGAARSYMVGICETLELADPEIDPPPGPERIAAEAEAYLEHLLERWRLPLHDVSDDQLEPPPELYHAGMPYWVDAMLEHAVMHPIRHGFQLEALTVQSERVEDEARPP